MAQARTDLRQLGELFRCDLFQRQHFLDIQALDQIGNHVFGMAGQQQ